MFAEAGIKMLPNFFALLCLFVYDFYQFVIMMGPGGGRMGLGIRSWLKHKSNELLQYNLNSNLIVISKNKLISNDSNRHYAQYKCFIVLKIRLI